MRDELLDPAGPPDTCRPLFQPTGLVLWCGPDRVRIGTGERSITLDRVNSATLAWLHGLDGTRTWGAIRREPLDEVTRSLFSLAWQLGCIDDAGIRPGAWWRSPGIARDGEAQRRALLHELGSAQAAHECLERRHHRRIAVVGSGPLAHLAVAIARRTQLQSTWVLGPGDDLPGDTACCVIADGNHPDLAGWLDQPACQLPHIPLRAHGLRAVVGPLIVPGHTSCLNCHHLHQGDSVSGWGQVAVQLTALAQRDHTACLDPLIGRLAAGQAILIARSLIDEPRRATATWGDQALQWTGDTGMPRVLRRPSHPLCGCRWNENAD